MNAYPLHAGVNLEMHHGTLTARLGRGFYLPQLVERRHGDFKIVIEVVRDLWAKNSSQHQDGRANTCCAQCDALFHERNADLFNALSFQRLRHLHKPVTVAVCLDDAHDRNADAAANRRMIICEGIKIDFDAGGTFEKRMAHAAIVGGA